MDGLEAFLTYAGDWLSAVAHTSLGCAAVSPRLRSRCLRYGVWLLLAPCCSPALHQRSSALPPCPDNNAVGYFSKQNFTKVVTLEKEKVRGFSLQASSWPPCCVVHASSILAPACPCAPPPPAPLPAALLPPLPCVRPGFRGPVVPSARRHSCSGLDSSRTMTEAR